AGQGRGTRRVRGQAQPGGPGGLGARARDGRDGAASGGEQEDQPEFEHAGQRHLGAHRAPGPGPGTRALPRQQADAHPGGFAGRQLPHHLFGHGLSRRRGLFRVAFHAQVCAPRQARAQRAARERGPGPEDAAAALRARAQATAGRARPARPGPRGPPAGARGGRRQAARAGGQAGGDPGAGATGRRDRAA
ncbi:hypothetical protein H632_c5371p0, partial [Helicosporidium sp. ATCC 50920]